MSTRPFAHSHALHVVIPTTSAEPVPQTPAEPTGPHSASFTNPDVARGLGNDPAQTRVQRDADTVFNDPEHGDTLNRTAGRGHQLGPSSSVLGNGHALAMVPTTPVRPGAVRVPSTPVSPRASRRATRTGSRFSVGEDHEERDDDRKGDFIAEAAMMLGVMARHLITGYMEHEEPSSEMDDHDGDEKGHV
ncbi:hypothetical protein LXA43DRAFT_646419 [Ganoderma leucocontextum]|nr:hypothetical protein LXA43DRAFT_646419 [Ganoderma leucocontextum]